MLSLPTAGLTMNAEPQPAQPASIQIESVMFQHIINLSSSERASEPDEMRTSATDESSSYTDRQRFSDVFSTLNVAPSISSPDASSPAVPPYAMVEEPPVVEISRSSFERKLVDFYGADIEDIAANPQRYSRWVSQKAQRTADTAFRFGTKSISEKARFFSYQLANKSVGLLRTEPGGRMSELFKGNDDWSKQFPGRDQITSTTAFRVTHPLVDNAGDILLEHQLQIDGNKPLVLSHSSNPEAKARAAALGFLEVSDSMMVLDPTKHEDKWKNKEGKWQRAGKPPLYLAATEDNSSNAKCTESMAKPANDPYDDDYDFM